MILDTLELSSKYLDARETTASENARARMHARIARLNLGATRSPCVHQGLPATETAGGMDMGAGGCAAPPAFSFKIACVETKSGNERGLKCTKTFDGIFKEIEKKKRENLKADRKTPSCGIRKCYPSWSLQWPRPLSYAGSPFVCPSTHKRALTRSSSLQQMVC